MKKFIKKIGICLVIVAMIISSIPSAFIVNAKENNYLEVVLPSNPVSPYVIYSQYKISDIMAISMIMDEFDESDDDGHYIVNPDGKRIINDYSDDGIMQYELVEGITSDECTFIIDDVVREALIEEFDVDLFDGYDGVHLSVGEYGEYETPDTLYLDLTSARTSLEMDFMSYYIFLSVFYSGAFFDDTIEYRSYESLDGKVLLNRKYVDKGGVKYEFTVPEDVTGDDDIICPLDDEDIATLQSRYDINASGKLRFIIAFGDNEYNEDDFVYNFSELGDNSSMRYNDAWSFMADKELVSKYYNYNEVTDGGEKIVSIREYNDIYFTFDILKDFGYEDNMVLNYEDYDEFFEDLFEEFGFEFNTIVIMFGNPEFIDGEDQEYDPESGEALSFRLNIPFDKFQESGEVYLDGELVDPENYVATEGSTIITFNDDFVAGLDEGDHEVKVVVADGYAAANFKIVGETVAEDTPETGDNLFLFISMLLLSAGGLYVVRKRLV